MHTDSAGIQRFHIKDVDALHLAQDLEPFQPGGLFEIGGDGPGRGAGGQEILFGFDICLTTNISAIASSQRYIHFAQLRWEKVSIYGQKESCPPSARVWDLVCCVPVWDLS